MTNLNCNAVSCTHNDNNYCCLDTVDIEGKSAYTSQETYCGDYRDCVDGSCNSNESPSVNHNVACEASNCSFNVNNHCVSSDISISGIQAAAPTDTVCTTFCAKN